MLRLCRLLSATLTICFLTLSTLIAQDTLNNAGVIGLKQAGLGDSVILNKIKVSKCDFDISTDGLQKLKEGGLSDEIINAIIASAASSATPVPPKVTAAVVSSDPSASHEPGIWLYQELGSERRMLKLRPARFIGNSEGWPAKSRVVFPGTAAVLQLSGNFSFYYYEEPKQEGAFAPPIMTADDFTLARLEVKDSKNTRRLVIGKTKFFGGKKTGLDPDQYIPVTVGKISDGISRIQPVKAILSGEYCFISKEDTSSQVLTPGRAEYYDFGVKK
jgi:hypothetical protein